MERLETAAYRASSGDSQGFGATPREALDALLGQVPAGTEESPIVILPYNRGDSFFTDAQQARLTELRARPGSLTGAERDELERLVAASFDATVARTRSLPRLKA